MSEASKYFIVWDRSGVQVEAFPELAVAESRATELACRGEHITVIRGWEIDLQAVEVVKKIKFVQP